MRTRPQKVTQNRSKSHNRPKPPHCRPKQSLQPGPVPKSLNARTDAAGLVPIETYATYTSLYCICMRPRFFLACVLPLAANFAIRKHSQNQDLFSWTYVFSNSSSDFDKYMMPSMMLIMLRTKLGTHISTPPTIYTTSLIIAEFEFPR